MLFSIIWCIARCVCCGLSCCCECCYCLKCCGNCCGCCSPPKGRRRKYLDEPYKNLPPDQGYQSHDPMSTGALPFASRPDPSVKSPTANPPQYAQFATFDVSKKDEGEDSLPAMPTWGDSESKRVETQAVELQDLKKTETNNGQAVPLMNSISPAATPVSRTPVNGGASPYGPPGSQAAASGYLGGAAGANPYGARNLPGQGYNQVPNTYGQSTASLGTEQSWGVTGGGYGQNTYTQEPASMHGYDDKAGYNQYDANGAMSGMNQPYGMSGATRSMTGGSNPSMRGTPARSMTNDSNASLGPPPSYPDRSRGSPAPPQGQFASDRQFDPRIAPQRTYSPAPQQQGQFPPNGPQRNFSPAPPQRSFSPAPQRNFSPGPQGSQRTYSPSPQQRQWSADAAPGRGPPPGGRGPPNRQYSADSHRSPRPMGGGPRPLPQRQYTADVPPGPRSPNFSRPTRSNTYDDNSYSTSGGGQQQDSAAYPGKW